MPRNSLIDADLKHIPLFAGLSKKQLTGLEQVLVTTYEEALVRTLADRLPDVQVLHVRDRRPPVPELAAT